MFFELLGVFILGFGIGYLVNVFQYSEIINETKKLNHLKKWLEGEAYIRSEDGKELDYEKDKYEHGVNYMIKKTINKIDFLKVD